MSIGNGNTGDANDFPSTSPGAVTAGTKSLTLNSNGQIDDSFIKTQFGDGSDGAIVLDGTNTYSFLTKSGSNYTLNRHIYCTNITINNGVTMTTNGFIFYYTGTLAGTGTITWGVANAGTAASASSAGVGGAASGAGPIKNLAGGNGGAPAGSGVTGGSSTSSPGGSGGAGAPGTSSNNPGQAGTASVGIKPGLFRVLSILGVDLSSTGLVTYAGGGGGGGGSSGGASNQGAGGGGGASGGGVIGVGNICTFTGTITCPGAVGAAGSLVNSATGGAGGGGGGGWSIMVYKSKTGSITYVHTGGAGPGNAGATGNSYEVQIGNVL